MPVAKEANVSVDFREQETATVVVFSGVLDVFSLQRIKDKVEKHLDGKRSVIFDMAGLNYIDSAGIGFVIGSLKRLKKADADSQLVICGLNEYLNGIFSLISFSRIIPIVDSAEEALKEFEN